MDEYTIADNGFDNIEDMNSCLGSIIDEDSGDLSDYEIHEMTIDYHIDKRYGIGLSVKEIEEGE